MPSEKLTRILLADSPFTKDQIAVMDEVAGWDWVYAQAAKKAQTKRPKVCFTGFSAVDKAQLVALADQTGFDVADSVSASLSYLCAGENAGPAKLAKATAAGCMVLTETAFHALLETGDLPRAVVG